MKKSLVAALARAQKQSMDFPQLDIRVLDKKGSRACVHASTWLCRDKLKQGWRVEATFRAGKRLPP